MCLRTGTDPLIGLKGWKETGDLIQHDIGMDIKEMEKFGVRTGLI